MVRTAWAIWWDAIAGLRRAWPQLVATGILYKLLTFVILTPLFSLAVRLFVSTSGNAFLADQDILYFVFSPWGGAALVLLPAVSIAIVALEQACLLTIGREALRSRYVPAIDALRFGLRRAPAILLLATHVTVRVLIIAAPFLAAGGGVFLLFLSEHDINFYLSERPPVFYVAVALAGLILTTLAFVLIPRLVAWAFALPMVIFESTPPGKALALSRERTKGHHKTILIVFALWTLGSTGISMAVLGLVTFVGHSLVDRAGDAVDWLVVAVGVFALLWTLGNLLVNLLSIGLFALLTVGVYDHLGGREADLSIKPAERGFDIRLRLRHVMWGATLAAVAATAVSVFLVYRIQTNRQVDVIAHRGAAGRAPENTMAAVEASIEDGTDWVEIDVQETADGEVVVIHDSDFMKIGGEPLKIWDATLEEARAIDIGSWFDPAFGGERIPTLEEVLAHCKGKAKVTVELKYYGHDEKLEQRVVDVVEGLEMETDVAIMSLKLEGIEKVRALRPEWRTGLLTATALGNLTRVDTDFLAVNTGMIDRLFVRSAHRSGKDVYVWTVNDALTMIDMMVQGVDGLITDEPALARDVVTHYNDLGTVERVLLTVALWLGETPAPIDHARELSGEN